jgi:hypothetical protein
MPAATEAQVEREKEYYEWLYGKNGTKTAASQLITKLEGEGV